MNVGLDMIYAPYTGVGAPAAAPDARVSRRRVRSRRSRRSTTSTSASIYEPAIYAEWEVTPWRGGRIVPGVRLDYAKDTKQWDLDPRVVVRQDLPRDAADDAEGRRRHLLAAAAAAGDERRLRHARPREQPRQPLRRRRRAGVHAHIEVSLDGFYKQLDHLVVQAVGNTGSGVVYGGETLLRYKPDARFFGWLAYTLSRSVRRDAPGQPLRLFQFDQTHILTVLGSYRLGRGWEFGARFRLISGYMYTPRAYGYLRREHRRPISRCSSIRQFGDAPAALPLARHPRRQDAGSTRWGSIGAYLDVLNVYNNGERRRRQLQLQLDAQHVHQRFAHSAEPGPPRGDVR